MEEVHTTAAPTAIGPYSQAIRIQDTVYLSGQIPLCPDTMTLCSEDIKMQAEQVLKNLAVVCEASGGSLENIVKISVYLIDLKNFSIVNEVMSEYFKPPYPARVAIGVAALPRDAKIEMDAIMILPLTRE